MVETTRFEKDGLSTSPKPTVFVSGCISKSFEKRGLKHFLNYSPKRYFSHPE